MKIQSYVISQIIGLFLSKYTNIYKRWENKIFSCPQLFVLTYHYRFFFCDDMKFKSWKNAEKVNLTVAKCWTERGCLVFVDMQDRRHFVNPSPHYPEDTWYCIKPKEAAKTLSVQTMWHVHFGLESYKIRLKAQLLHSTHSRV